MLLKTIDINAHFAVCNVFRRDSYQISFGNHHGVDESLQGYQKRMTARINALPQGNCHLWYEDTIIGQTEMKLVPDLSVGYVNLFYLTKAFRGQGLGRSLLDRAIQVFSALGKTQLQLSVSTNNKAALSFYSKHGFNNLGPKPGNTRMFLMSKPLP